MYPEATGSNRRLRRHQPSILDELIRAGKESYFIVSQFNLFEYEQEAPLFARLSDSFERLLLGLTLVREDLGPRKCRAAFQPPRVTEPRSSSRFSASCLSHLTVRGQRKDWAASCRLIVSARIADDLELHPSLTEPMTELPGRGHLSDICNFAASDGNS